MAVSERIQVPLPISSSKTTHIMHKCHFNYEYITVGYKGNRVSSTFSVCLKDNIWYYPAVMLSKHGPSRMSHFFHGEFFTVNGLPMYVRHIIVYNTNVTIQISMPIAFNF